MAFSHIFILLLLWNRTDANPEKCSAAAIHSGHVLHFTCIGVEIMQVSDYLSNLKKILSKPIQLTLEETIFQHIKGSRRNKEVKLAPYWLKGDIKVQHVCIENSYLYAISNYAFKTPQFINLEVFELINVPIQQIYTKSLSGLDNLKALVLRDIQLGDDIGENILAPCAKLEVFTMHSCGIDKISLSNFFGKSEYNRLYKVDIGLCNLDGTINDETFWGLKALKELRLYNCNLKEIKPHTFDKALKTLTQLDLDFNLLTTLPRRIFKAAKGTNITINLRNNPWHCDCELNDLRDFIQRNKLVKFHNVICKSPPDLKEIILIALPSLCKQSATENSMEVVNIQLNLTTQSQELVAMKNTFNLECDSATNMILTKPSAERTPSIYTKNSMLTNETIQFSKDFNLLEFEPIKSNEIRNGIQSTGNASIKCLFTPKNIMLYRRKLKPFHMYRFCVIKRNSSTLLPLDCSVLYSTLIENKSDAWLFIDDKILAICLCALFMFVAFAVGFSIPFGIAKFYRRKYRPFTSRVVDVTIPSRDNDDIVQSQGKIETVKQMKSTDAYLRHKSSSRQWQRSARQMPTHQVFKNFKIDEKVEIDDGIPPPLPPRNSLKPIST